MIKYLGQTVESLRKTWATACMHSPDGIPINVSISEVDKWQKTDMNLIADFVSPASSWEYNEIAHRLYYRGEKDIHILFNATAVLSNAGTPNMVIRFAIFKNGSILFNTISFSKLENLTTSSVSIDASSCFLLKKDEYIEIYSKSDKANTFDINNLQLQFNESISSDDVSEYAYGVRWNETLDTWTRLGQNRSFTNFNNVFPYNKIKRCNVADDGTVNAYYGDPTFIEDGTNGQVMVEYLKTYFKYLNYVDGSNTYHEWWISETLLAGFKIHPAFNYGVGVTKDKMYTSAYEGSIYDTSAGVHLLADEQIADFTPTTGDKLSSIKGAKPCSGLTQALSIVNSRILAKNRGTGWGLWNGNQVAFVQHLFIIEYASFNPQDKIGLGVVNKASGTANESEITGATSFLGNTTGRQSGTDGLTSVTYRGLENMWGNIWLWVDGINIQADNKLWVNTTNINMVSDSYATPYSLVGTLSNTNGYVSKIFGTEYGLFATENTGSSTTRLHDYYYQSTGNRVASLGGGWSDGSTAGFACWRLDTSSGSRGRNVGSRLAKF